MIDFIEFIWLTLGIVVFGGAMLAFLLHSADVVWYMTKGRKK